MPGVPPAKQILNPDGKFCRLCGETLEGLQDTEPPSVLFDTRSGRRLSTKICINPKCLDGCVNLGHHKPGWFSNCSNCNWT